ncbi:MAG: hypothetical protein KF764_22275 [Labilithrix sp.]|nr:hypothetical protein [Labilithrix sp.]
MKPSRVFSAFATLAALAALVAACGSSPGSSVPGGRACTDIGCDNGVKVDFTFREAGQYVFEVTVDGEKTVCRASLPLESSFSNPCDRTDVLLGLVGSALPPAQQSIGGLTLTTTTAGSVTIRATRDGALLGEKTIRIAYDVTPGPNGPDCEPKECKSAKATFP